MFSTTQIPSYRSHRLVLGTAALVAVTGCFSMGCRPSGATEPAVSAPVAWPQNPLSIAVPGSYRLTVISPTVLELEFVARKEPDPSPAPGPDFIATPPAPGDFQVLANGQAVPVARAGYKRRALYAPLKQRDLRLANWVHLELQTPLPSGAKVQVRESGRGFAGPGANWSGELASNRLSPALHVSEGGYVANGSKVAFAGYYLGSLGELAVPGTGFQLLDAAGKSAFSGQLRSRPDNGWSYSPYQQVMEADFSAFKTPGTYRLAMSGLGVSLPFRIGDEPGALWARTYAQGLYNQRCGQALTLPYTRFVHAPCHAELAEIPDGTFATTNRSIQGMSESAKKNPRHTAPVMTGVEASLYPFVKRGKIDVSGGHHDAGDYSVYTINSAQLVSLLTFAADAFPGAGELDNLGLPESGDGKSDLLQEARWEADFLVKMQDSDGGFFFLKYPKDRKYEDNVLPERGDPQVVFPKNTAGTAAATAALAQMVSSPRFKREFPAEAGRYRVAALNGWKFLQAAVAKYGRDGSYQMISHYGDVFGHDDELTWAAVEIFLLTGDKSIPDQWLADYDPGAPANLHWSWERMFQSYGCANRSYAFAVQTGRAKEDALDPKLLKLTRAEVIAAAQDQADRARQSAYGTSFPIESKRYNAAGWYFSSTPAFDLAAGYALEPRPEFMAALLTNFGFEWGANPLNLGLVTGEGTNRLHEVVHQYAQNDRRMLPPSGIPQGNVWGGFMYLNAYKRELGFTTFPLDGDAKTPYAPMDRVADSFNVTAEFTVPNQGAALGAAALVMAQSPLKSQPWKPGVATLTGAPANLAPGSSATLRFDAPGMSIEGARIVWEAAGQDASFGQELAYKAPVTGPSWAEAEVLWPDGRRLSAAMDFPGAPPPAVAANAGMAPVALKGTPAYPLQKAAATVKTAETKLFLDFDDVGSSPADLQAWVQARGGKVTGQPTTATDDLAWMTKPSGAALSFTEYGQAIDLPVGNLTGDFSLSGWLRIDRDDASGGPGVVFGITGDHANDVMLGLAINNWVKGAALELRAGTGIVVTVEQMAQYVIPGQWQRWELSFRGGDATAKVDGHEIYKGRLQVTDGLRPRLAHAHLGIGLMRGRADDVVLK